MKNYIQLSVFLIITCFLFSCKKEETSNTSGRDAALSEILSGDVYKVADNTIKQENLAERLSAFTCASITLSPNDLTTFPKNIVVDFGTVNCLGEDGRIRRGKLNINMTERFKTTGSIIQITPDNYFVQDHQVTGIHTVTNNGLNTEGNLNFDVNVADCTITSPSGSTLSWESQRNYKWITGDATLTVFDDVYNVSGNGNGVNSEGNAFSLEITNPLVRDMSCKWFKQGSIMISNAGGGELLLDFGSGACDDNATVTINDNTININLN